MTTTRPMTKSAPAVARQALHAARAALPACAPKFPKKTYTQRQRFAPLAVREFLRTDYRGLEQHLRDWSDLRAAVGLGEDVPDHPTVQKAADRRLKKSRPTPCSPRPPRRPAPAG